MKKRIKASLCIGSLLLNFPLVSYAGCHASITNNSSQNWEVFFDNRPAISGQGNVYFTNALNCVESVNGPCVIKPGQSFLISYTTDYGNAGGSAYLTSSASYPYPQMILSYDSPGIGSKNSSSCVLFSFVTVSGNVGKVDYGSHLNGGITFSDN